MQILLNGIECTNRMIMEGDGVSYDHTFGSKKEIRKCNLWKYLLPCSDGSDFYCVGGAST
jgi:hypothetical protein